MKRNLSSRLIRFASGILGSGLLVAAASMQASTDYAPAIWNQAYSGHWYTSGNGHKFCVIHTCEGYYYGTISYLKQSGTQASAHYVMNSDYNSDGADPGELTQMVREAYYAWHARCWNTYSYGTEHEGFISNPAWYTDAMYQSSAALHRHLCDVHGIAKDRNHIVGHNAKESSAWCSYAEAAFGIDAHCNDHTDPGQYWDWSTYMEMINPVALSMVQSGPRMKGDFNADGREDVVIEYDYGNRTSKYWVFLSAGSSFAAPTTWWTSSTWDATNSQCVVGDFTGDGKADIASLYDYGDGDSKIWVWTSTGSTFNVPAVWWTSSPGGFNAKKARILVGDFNADGKSDFAAAYDYGNRTMKIWVWTSTGSGFSNPTVWFTTTTWDLKEAQMLTGDFNGDGKADVAGAYDYGSSDTKVWVFLSSGSAFSSSGTWWTSLTWNLGQSKIYGGDCNGDGKTDLVAAYDYNNATTRLYVFTSSGSAFSGSYWWASDSGSYDAKKSKWVVGDFTGGGYADVAGMYDYGSGSSKLWVWTSNGSNTLTPAVWWSSTTWTWSKSVPF